LGLEFGGLLDEDRCHIRIRDCAGEFEERCCLTRQIMPADHFVVSSLQSAVASAADVTLQRGIRSSPALQSEHLILFQP
jgi:hypothetical protein